MALLAIDKLILNCVSKKILDMIKLVLNNSNLSKEISLFVQISSKMIDLFSQTMAREQ